MVNFADCVSKVQYRNLVTTTPTKNGIKELLVSTSKILPSLEQDRVMFSMGAKYKGKKSCFLSEPIKSFKLGGLSIIADNIENFKLPIEAKKL